MAETFVALGLNLSPAQLSRCKRWTDQFAAIVAQSPLNLRCEVEWVSGELRDLIVQSLRGESLALVDQNILNSLFDHPRWGAGLRLPKVVVFCRTDHPLRTIIMKQWPHARWGGSLGGTSVIYEERRGAAWHEMLHLLGAEDCYDPNNPDGVALPTCGHSNCIMQYAPNLGESENSFFLCESNAERIRRPTGNN